MRQRDRGMGLASSGLQTGTTQPLEMTNIYGATCLVRAVPRDLVLLRAAFRRPPSTQIPQAGENSTYWVKSSVSEWKYFSF